MGAKPQSAKEKGNDLEGKHMCVDLYYGMGHTTNTCFCRYFAKLRLTNLD